MAKYGEKEWDAFISHAVEDQQSFVRPLAKALVQLGVKVWYSEFSLRLGDSLSRSIDAGLARSRHGVVVLSPHFFRKRWPERELQGLVAKEIDQPGTILPIWHGVDRHEVLEYSPSLADKVAVKTSAASADEIALQILSVVRPDIYGQHDHANLRRLASGEALAELQEELDGLKEALSEFQCPYCGAALATCQEVPVDPEEKHWDTFKQFECGQTLGGANRQRPCPANPKFPKLREYEFRFHREGSGDTAHWIGTAFPLTENAKSLSLPHSYERDKERAALALQETYARLARRT